MTLDPVAVVGALAAMGGLLLFITRAFATGAIMPRSVVPREDYEALLEINASYPSQIGAAAEAVKALTEALRAEKAKNGATS